MGYDFTLNDFILFFKLISFPIISKTNIPEFYFIDIKKPVNSTSTGFLMKLIVLSVLTSRFPFFFKLLSFFGCHIHHFFPEL